MNLKVNVSELVRLSTKTIENNMYNIRQRNK